MKDGIPLIYWTFRTAWTVLHFLIVLAAAAALLGWAINDGNGQRVLGGAMSDLLDVQQTVARAIPWPWAA